MVSVDIHRMSSHVLSLRSCKCLLVQVLTSVGFTKILLSKSLRQLQDLNNNMENRWSNSTRGLSMHDHRSMVSYKENSPSVLSGLE